MSTPYCFARLGCDRLGTMAGTLCFDFGNTRCKYAVFNEEHSPREFILSSNEPLLSSVKAAVEQHRPRISVLCSVIGHDEAIGEFLAKQSVFIRVSAHIPLPIRIHYKSPETLGPDRIALAAGAAHLFPRRPLLVIACGTCITYNFISEQGIFIGGAISPGLRMRFSAMHDYTQKLPYCEPTSSFDLIGTDTPKSLQSGVLHGITAELDGIINRYRKQYNDIFTVLCGGDAPFLIPHLENSIQLEPHLLFIGLHAIALHHAPTA